MNSTAHRPQILVLDDGSAWSESFAREADEHGSGARASVTTSVDEAVRRLTTEPFDAVVLSMEVGEDAATTLVAELERAHPGLPLVGVTSKLDDSVVAQACHLGVTALTTAPVSVSSVVDASRFAASDAGFSGSCVGIPTAQLLTLHCSAGADGVLHLRCAATSARPERFGSIYLEAGQPVHATAGEQVGPEAVHTMLGWVDAEATWIPGYARPARTIVGRWQGLLARSAPDTTAPGAEMLEDMVSVAYPEVIEKLSRLSQTTDVLGAFLLRHAEVVAGRCAPEIDEPLASRALCRLAHVFFDVEAQVEADAGREIQAIVGTMRLVLDRIGPPEAGFQVGVYVRQAAPVCKSLRRLLRQIDSAFFRAMKRRAKEIARERPTAPELPLFEQRVA